MFSTKNLVHDIKSVPIPWIFEHFCNLPEKLSGQTVKIISPFSPVRTPSLAIYYREEKSCYYFKCFSSGENGNAVELVKKLTNFNYFQASQLIIEKYNDFILHNNGGYDVAEFKESSKYKVSKVEFRPWNTQDQYFWTQFNIGSRLLEYYCVRPLSHYTMEKEIEGELKTLTITGNYIYGYFEKDGTLYKIYQPKTLDKKFIKVNDCVQGWEQCSFNTDFLLIVSSLKDIMSIRSLKLKNIDIIAPETESALIKKDLMETFRDNYKKILILYDNDEAGIKSMQKHREKYPYVKCLLLNLAKDPSDSIKQFGVEKTRNILVPLITNNINER